MLKLKTNLQSFCAEKLLPKENCTLFVGEGNFSFAANYVRNLENTKCFEIVTATALVTKTLSCEEKSNIVFIRNHGGLVYLDVDATKLEQHHVVSKFVFSKIFFHFPHVPKKMNIKENRKLVEHFLISAEKVLHEDGIIGVTLCRKQGGTNAEVMPRLFENTWKVVNLATSANLILCKIEPFDSQVYDTYKCTGYRGLSKRFGIEEAVTHFFCKGQPVSIPFNNYESFLEKNTVEYFIQEMKNFYKSLSRKDEIPYTRVVHTLDAAAREASSSFHAVFIPDLLICGDFSSSSAPYEIEDNLELTNLCDKCVNNLVLQLVNCKKNDSVTNSMVCCMCCTYYFNLYSSPFMHIMSFICSEESLQKNLEYILNALDIQSLSNIPNFCWFDISSRLNARCMTSEQSNFPLCSITYPFSIYIVCSVIKSDCCLFYTDTQVVVCHRNSFHAHSDKKSFEIGHIMNFANNTNMYNVIVLNLEMLSAIKYHIFEKKILLLNEGHFCQKVLQGHLTTVYSSISLYPPSYKHDVSFWVEEHFEEKSLLILAWNIVGSLIKSITLIDLYYEHSIKKASRCYRIEYQSFSKVLSWEGLLKVHNFLRNAIKVALKVQLR